MSVRERESARCPRCPSRKASRGPGVGSPHHRRVEPTWRVDGRAVWMGEPCHVPGAALESEQLCGDPDLPGRGLCRGLGDQVDDLPPGNQAQVKRRVKRREDVKM